jgi:hypothetical protein
MDHDETLVIKDIDTPDNELATGRGHAFYQREPDNTGLYHCPWEGKELCNHKPTKLKCNYE